MGQQRFGLEALAGSQHQQLERRRQRRTLVGARRVCKTGRWRGPRERSKCGIDWSWRQRQRERQLRSLQRAGRRRGRRVVRARVLESTAHPHPPAAAAAVVVVAAAAAAETAAQHSDLKCSRCRQSLLNYLHK